MGPDTDHARRPRSGRPGRLDESPKAAVWEDAELDALGGAEVRRRGPFFGGAQNGILR